MHARSQHHQLTPPASASPIAIPAKGGEGARNRDGKEPRQTPTREAGLRRTLCPWINRMTVAVAALQVRPLCQPPAARRPATGKPFTAMRSLSRWFAGRNHSSSLVNHSSSLVARPSNSTLERASPEHFPSPIDIQTTGKHQHCHPTAAAHTRGKREPQQT